MNELLKECRRALEGAAELVEDRRGRADGPMEQRHRCPARNGGRHPQARPPMKPATTKGRTCYMNHRTGEHDHMNAHIKTDRCRAKLAAAEAEVARLTKVKEDIWDGFLRQGLEFAHWVRRAWHQDDALNKSEAKLTKLREAVRAEIVEAEKSYDYCAAYNEKHPTDTLVAGRCDAWRAIVFRLRALEPLLGP